MIVCSVASRIRYALAVCVFLLVAIPHSVRAQQAEPENQAKDPHEVQPERPTVATHAGTVAPDWVELEIGGEWDRYTDGSRVLSFPANLKIGVSSRAQLNILATGFRGTTADPAVRGVGDVTFGLKYRLIDDGPVVGDFAILPAIKLPTAPVARGLGSGTTDFSLLLISSHSFGPVDMDINLGATHRSGDGIEAPKTSSIWALSAGAPIVGQLGWTGEVFGFPGTSGQAGAKPIVAILTGPTYQAATWLAMDVGIIEPLTGPQPRALYAGLVWNIGKLP